jgi:hypothetical protein
MYGSDFGKSSTLLEREMAWNTRLDYDRWWILGLLLPTSIQTHTDAMKTLFHPYQRSSP